MPKSVSLSLLALSCLMFVAGCGKSGSSSGDEPATLDAGTVTTVRESIAKDKQLTGADIKVAPQGASVDLEGTVTTIAQKDEAEQDVLTTLQARHQPIGVLNNLQIKEDASSNK